MSARLSYGCLCRLCDMPCNTRPSRHRMEFLQRRSSQVESAGGLKPKTRYTVRLYTPADDFDFDPDSVTHSYRRPGFTLTKRDERRSKC
jgi:hypothetical protein